MRQEQSLEGYRASVLPLIEATLRRAVEGGDLRDLYRYVVEGGKRLRPTLTLLVCDALGGDRGMALDLACSAELTHCASLCLDDILDGHGERRGKAALHLAEDLRQAVTTGFTLPSIALNLAARHGAMCAQTLSEAWVSMCLGVYLEETPETVSWEAYRRIIELKTGRLFAASSAFGALASRRDEESFRRFGLHLGNAYQMADDLQDGWGGEWLPRLQGHMTNEVHQAEAEAAAWGGSRPELLAILRRAPRELLGLKGAVP
ncbi:MAG: polyprenyl synthetase family protein [Thermoplasmata archaeon]